jgi:hypothetical protein
MAVADKQSRILSLVEDDLTKRSVDKALCENERAMSTR